MKRETIGKWSITNTRQVRMISSTILPECPKIIREVQSVKTNYGILII